MDIYVSATFIGSDGTHGYTHDNEYELSIHAGSTGGITIYQCLDDQDWIFEDLNSFLQNWSYVSLK